MQLLLPCMPAFVILATDHMRPICECLLAMPTPAFSPRTVDADVTATAGSPMAPAAPWNTAPVGGAGGAMHESDEFRMYSFKVKRCGKTRSHDWTECPYAHRGEKARRRDPRKFFYQGVDCAEFRRVGGCSRGQLCEFAHGVFEFWLHPTRYRTRPCMAGPQCQRKVCFFAHTPEQLRPGGLHGGRPCCLPGGAGGFPTEPLPWSPFPPPPHLHRGDGGGDVSEYMGRLEIADGVKKNGGFGRGEASDCPDIDWICELVE